VGQAEAALQPVDVVAEEPVHGLEGCPPALVGQNLIENNYRFLIKFKKICCPLSIRRSQSYDL
jgi:hypothetical protein